MADPKSRTYWNLAKELAEACLHEAEACLRAGLLGPCFEYLNKAKVATVPPQGEKWTKKPDWLVLRLRIFEKLADYFHRYESSRSQ